MPVGVLSWQHAAILTFMGRVALVEVYPERRIRSATLAIPWPAVVQDQGRRTGIHLSPNRPNVLARDQYRCLYCGLEPKMPNGRPNLHALTIDHVVPKSRARSGYVEAPWYDGALIPVNDWSNLATACPGCNGWKGSSTPWEAGMEPIRWPFVPGLLSSIRIVISKARIIPSVWEPYLTF